MMAELSHLDFSKVFGSVNHRLLLNKQVVWDMLGLHPRAKTFEVAVRLVLWCVTKFLRTDLGKSSGIVLILLHKGDLESMINLTCFISIYYVIVVGVGDRVNSVRVLRKDTKLASKCNMPLKVSKTQMLTQAFDGLRAIGSMVKLHLAQSPLAGGR